MIVPRPLSPRRRSDRTRLNLEVLEGRTLLSVNLDGALGVGPGITPLSEAIGPDGSSYVAGKFGGTVDFDPGPGVTSLSSNGGSVDAFVAKYAANGSLVWAYRFGDNGTDLANAVAVDGQGGVYVTGEFTGTVDFDPGAGTATLTTGGVNRFDAFVLKLTEAGAFSYVAQASGAVGSETAPYAITADASGNAYITGMFQGATTFGTIALPGSSTFGDGFVARVNPAGTFNLAVPFAASPTGTSQAIGYGIALDSNGNIVTTGRFLGTVDFDPGAGTTSLTTTGTTGFPDAYVAKLTSAGALTWARSFGGPDFEQGSGVATDPAGNIYATGQYTGTVDFDPGPGVVSRTPPAGTGLYALKLTPQGDLAWATDLGVRVDDTTPGSSGIVVDPTGVSYVAGSYVGTAHIGGKTQANRGLSDLFVAQLNRAGAVVSASTGGGAGADVAYGIARNAAGAIVVAGSYSGAPTFGNSTLPDLTASGMIGMFVARASSTPVPSVPGDFDGDGKTDTGVYQPGPSSYFLRQTTAGNVQFTFGQGSLYGGNPIPIVGDFDGDGKADTGVYQPSTSSFFLRETTGGNVLFSFGQGTQYGGNPIPIVGDFDGDGKDDLGVYQPGPSSYFLRETTGGNVQYTFGQGTQYGGSPIPIVGDFDGDGKTDTGVYQPGPSSYFLRETTGGNVQFTFGQGSLYGGKPIPIVGDFDGDGKTDTGVYQPGPSSYFLRQTTAGNAIFSFGQGTQYGGNPVAVTGDFDGDGKTDLGVYQPGPSSFFLRQTTAGNAVYTFGQGTQYAGNPVPLPLGTAYETGGRIRVYQLGGADGGVASVQTFVPTDGVGATPAGPPAAWPGRRRSS